MKKVYVGLSGGVDSSVTAALLLQQGFEVVGVYMKNWAQDLPGFACPWKQDYQDAKRVAVQLGIGFKMYDFQAEYHKQVVDYMIVEYQAGRTPNPDIMCNQEVKFKLFLETALADGADMIATGHYARIEHTPIPVIPDLIRDPVNQEESPTIPTAELLTAYNLDKDQTYFLYRVTGQALAKSLMPIGEFTTKAEVRALAKKFGLVTANKKDSQGICFVGKVGIKDFLQQYVTTQPGPIIDENGREIGQHDGAIFYTLGQRHGLNIGGGLPYYVTGKDMASNTVTVSTDLNNSHLWHKSLKLTSLHWINQPPAADQPLQVRTRYRAPLIDAKINITDSHTCQVELADEVRALTPGQSAVFYNGEHVLGGGIII